MKVDKDAEIARLHAFTLQVAERLFLAAEVISIRAEKREMSQDLTFGQQAALVIGGLFAIVLSIAGVALWIAWTIILPVVGLLYFCGALR